MKYLFLILSISTALSSRAFSNTGDSAGPLWKQYSDSAKLFQEQKSNGKAIEYYLKANELLKKDSALTMSYFQNNNDIGDLYTAMGQYAKAEPFIAAGKEIIEKIQGKNAAYATSCNNLGRVYRLIGQYDKSEPLLLEAKELREKLFGKENADYATSCNNLAALYLDAGLYDLAGQLHLEAKQIRERVLGKEHIDYATSCNNLAILYMVTGKPDAAEPLYIEAKNIREKVLGKEHPFYAASCNNLAALYLDRGQYGKAEPLYIEAKQIRERTLGKEHPDYAASCDNLAILYMDIGKYEQAEALYMEARQIREKILGTRHPDYARGCNNLALLYRSLGQFEKAATLFTEARDILGASVGKEHFEYAKSCNNLGVSYMDIGDYEKATSLYDEARQIFEKVLGKEHPEYAKSCNNLALVYRNRGQLEKAESLFLEAMQIRAKVLGKEHPDYAASCDNLAVLYTDMRQYSKAAPLHLQAKQIREKALGTEHPDYLQSCINLANVNWNMGEYENATNLYKQAFNSQQTQVKKVFQFTTEPEKQAYIKKVTEYKNYSLSYSSSGLSSSGPAYTYAVTLANRNLILSSSRQLRQAIYNTNDTALANKYNDWMIAREQLAPWYVKPVSERTAQFKLLEDKANALEKELTSSSDIFRKEQQEITWQNIRQSLKPGEAAIEFTEFQYYNGKRWTDSTYYIALVLTKNKPQPELVSLFEKRQLDSLLNGNTENDGDGITAIYSNALHSGKKNADTRSLYDLIWKPIEKSLGGITKIYFAPSGNLHRISFAGLPVDSRKVLSDKYKLVQLNTTASIADKPADFITTADQIQLYGGVKYDAEPVASKMDANDIASSRSLPDDSLRGGGFKYLPGTEKEVAQIERLGKEKDFRMNSLVGLNATEESIKGMNSKKASILHIATHGFFFDDPAGKKKSYFQQSAAGNAFKESDNPLFRSGLLFAGANNAWRGKKADAVEDGILTAYEVSNLHLPGTKLVVLSACETALGDIQGSEGVFGLQRAFKMAGVQNLIMSLWKVPDTESAEFMEDFYKNLFSKRSISEAFSFTQTKMKNKYRNEPNKWAAWVLVR